MVVGIVPVNPELCTSIAFMFGQKGKSSKIGPLSSGTDEIDMNRSLDRDVIGFNGISPVRESCDKKSALRLDNLEISELIEELKSFRDNSSCP